MLHKKDDCSFRGKQKLHTLLHFSALLLLYRTRDQGIALQVSLQVCNQTGEIPHFQVFGKPLASEGLKASQGVMGQKKNLVMF